MPILIGGCCAPTLEVNPSRAAPALAVASRWRREIDADLVVFSVIVLPWILYSWNQYIRFCRVVFVQIRPSAVRITRGVNGISVIIAPNGFSASFTALATAAAAAAVPGPPAPFAPNSVSHVGDTTRPTSISGISPDIGTR